VQQKRHREEGDYRKERGKKRKGKLCNKTAIHHTEQRIRAQVAAQDTANRKRRKKKGAKGEQLSREREGAQEQKKWGL